MAGGSDVEERIRSSKRGVPTDQRPMDMLYRRYLGAGVSQNTLTKAGLPNGLRMGICNLQSLTVLSLEGFKDLSALMAVGSDRALSGFTRPNVALTDAGFWPIR